MLIGSVYAGFLEDSSPWRLATRRVRLSCFFYGRADCEAGAIVANKSAATRRRVGLSMMCYTEGKEKRTCFGECQPNGRMGKLL